MPEQYVVRSAFNSPADEFDGFEEISDWSKPQHPREEELDFFLGDGVHQRQIETELVPKVMVQAAFAHPGLSEDIVE